MPDRVLLIDDDFAITKALTVRLRAMGYSVEAAADGRSGKAAAERFHPDVILLDIRMPDLTGFEVCRWLKGQLRLADIPVIFLSANITDDNRREAIDAGSAAFIAKPYEAKQVIDCIQKQGVFATKSAPLASGAPNHAPV